MSPYDEIKAKYDASDHETPWLAELERYHREGFVFSGPAYFVAGIEARFEEKDCWYIFAAAGDITAMWDHLPYPLGWVAFERIRAGQRELDFYPTERLRRLAPAKLPESEHETVFTD